MGNSLSYTVKPYPPFKHTLRPMFLIGVSNRIFSLLMGNRVMCSSSSFFSLLSAFPCPSSILHGVFALSLNGEDSSCDRNELDLPRLLSNLPRGSPILSVRPNVVESAPSAGCDSNPILPHLQRENEFFCKLGSPF